MNSEKEQGQFSHLDALRGSLREIQERIAQMEQQLEALERNGRTPESQNGHVFRLDLAAVSESVRQLSAADSQEHILEAYLSQIQRFADRFILFLQNGNQFRPWKAIEFPQQSLESLSISDATDLIMRAAASRETILQDGAVFQHLPWLAGSGDEPGRCVCLPLVFDDLVPVVLYADSRESIDVDSLELLTHLTVLVLKNHYLSFLLGSQHEVSEPEAHLADAVPDSRMKAAAVEEVEVSQPPQPFKEAPDSAFGVTEVTDEKKEAKDQAEAELEAAPFQGAEADQVPSFGPLPAETPPEGTTPAVETAPFETEAAGWPEEHPQMQEAGPEDRIGEGLEELAEEPQKYGGVSEQPFEIEEKQPPTEPVAGQVLQEGGVEVTAETAEAAPEAVTVEAMVAPAPVVSSEEEPLHNDARRFARLLVSEIKLYNEQEVEAGRSQRDLYRRLQTDIDRSREMYEKRVHASVKQSYDYFHSELVRILSRDDPSLLGEGYPGEKLSTRQGATSETGPN